MSKRIDRVIMSVLHFGPFETISKPKTKTEHFCYLPNKKKK